MAPETPLLEINSEEHRFVITFKGMVMIEHRPEAPCIFLGNAENDFGMLEKHNAYYKKGKPASKDLRIHGLRDFFVKESGEKRAIIQFEKELEVQFSVKENRLVIEISLLNDSEYNRFILKLKAFKDEAIFGLGEQFTELDMKGREIPLWTVEPGLHGEGSIVGTLAGLIMGAQGSWYTTYFPQPTFVSTKHYFVHADSYAFAWFDFRNPDIHSLLFWEIPSRLVVDVGKTMVETISSLSACLGRQRPLPDWVIDGVWLGIGGGMGDGERPTVPWKVEKALQGGVKVGAIWVEDWTGLRIYSKYEKRLFWNWQYDEERYPGLPDYIKELHNRGIKFLAYNNCFLMKNGELYKKSVKNGYLLKTRDGEPYDVRMYSFSAGMLDLTNPKTWDWIKGIVKKNMIDIGIDGWMCDFAEYVPVDCKLDSGEDPGLLHNKYPVLWAKVNHEAVEEAGRLEGDDAIVFFSRSGNHGSSRYSALVWAGDQFVTFSKPSGFPSVIVAGISLGFCGIGHHCADIAGLFDILWIKRTKDLFMRCTEYAAFTCVMRTHDGKDFNADRNWTWFSDEETLAHFARFSHVHAKLKPYIRHVLEEYQETGLPAMRHPYLHYEGDGTALQLKYQYLFGRDLLVAPVIKKKKKHWKVYLPKDDWVHLWSHEKYDGGWIDVDAPHGEPPVFFREKSEFSSLFKEFKDL